jgi:hypothetical protein
MCYKGFSIWAQAVRARPLMRPRRAVLLTPPLQTSALLKTRLSPFLATHPRNRPVSPLLATLPKTASRKPFVCHTYETPPGGCFSPTANGKRRIEDPDPVGTANAFARTTHSSHCAGNRAVQQWPSTGKQSRFLRCLKKVSGQAGPASSKPEPGRRSILG